MTTLTDNVEIASAVYANLFDQKAGSELYRQFLSAPEIAGTRNSKEVRVRKFGAFTASLYGGPGTIDPTTDYERPNDTTITVTFDRTAMVLVGVDTIEHELTELGERGSQSGLAQDASSTVRDFVVTDVLALAASGATQTGTPAGTLSGGVFIEAGKKLDAKKVPKSGRIAIIDSVRAWDLFDGTSTFGIDAREVPSMIRNGMIPDLFGFTVFITTLLPDGAGSGEFQLFAHQSALIAKAADELPRVKIIDDVRSIGSLLQIFQRFGRVVADTDRIVKTDIG